MVTFRALPVTLPSKSSVATFAASALLAACSATAGVPSAREIQHFTQKQSIGTYPTTSSLVFESEQSQGAVNIYKTIELLRNPAPIASIKVSQGCPYGLAMDSGGTVYVADACGSSDVELYPKGSTAMSKSITDGISDPLGLAIDDDDTLYVSNSSGTITEYPKGTTSPSRTIAGGDLYNPFGLAIDSHQNLYIADYGAGAIFEVKAGTSKVMNLNLEGLRDPVGLAIDQKFDVLWETEAQGGVINVYRLRSNSKKPFKVIPSNGEPYAIAVQNHGSPVDEVVASSIVPYFRFVHAFQPYNYRPHAKLTNNIYEPTGLLIAKP